ncbi:MAG: amino acid ABC transporter permease [Roseiarcus sp.]|uniref:amino acid ABC transporter permease n=1 Tax=Roseiarcus sp. TaxID=1969460 RepID=UPI003BB0C1B7
MAQTLTYVRFAPEPEEPPPVLLRGPVAWARDNLFSSIASGLTTLTFVALAIRLLPPMIAWATTLAVWNAPDGALCRQHQDGACWAFIAAKLDYLRFGSYPASERWRVDLVEALGASLTVWLLWPKAPCRGWAAALFFAVYPVLTLALLRGSEALRLPIVDVLLWGGMLVSFLTAIVGIVFSLPLGVVLALGRRSQMPVVRLASIMFIEFVRGVPFIAILFMANTMLPLFVPEAWAPDRLLRPLIGIALFSAAYMAEEVRGGLQSLGRSQYEGAMALGLDYPRMMALVVLPQALTMVIPGIVNNFIGLFMDTTLISVVGLTDFLEAMNNAFKDPAWSGPTIVTTGYAFAGMFYFAFCYGMARYSRFLERMLAEGRRR